MRFFRPALILFIIAAIAAALPIPSAVGIDWDIASTGNDNNGGLFLRGATGTDYSTQNAAHASTADLASVNATGNCDVTSATYTFVGTDVGNGVQITAGANATLGFYYILSVAAGAARLDRPCGTAAALAAVTFSEGGRLATVQKILSSIGTGNRAWLKNATYTQTVNLVITNTNLGAPGSVGSATLNGYNTTHGDLSGTGAFTNHPIVTTATNATNLILLQNGPKNINFKNIVFSNTAGTRAFGVTTTGAIPEMITFQHCRLTGFTRPVYADHAVVWGIGGLYFDRSEIDNSSDTTAAVWNSFGTQMTHSYIHDNAGAGYFPGTSIGTGLTWVFNWNVFYNNKYCVDMAINGGDNWHFNNNACVSSTTAGLNIRVGNWINFLFYNNVFCSNPIDVANSANTNQFNGIFAGGNAYCGTSTAWIPADITLAVSPFTNPAGGDFTPNSAVTGGALLKGAGYPGALPASVGTGYIDAGPLQVQALPPPNYAF